jgi:hypothetical protein
MRTRWTRRDFLRSAGVTAGAGALAALFPIPAAAGNQPKRLVLITHGQGADMTRWSPTGTETSFTLSYGLSPLAPIQDRLLVLDGIDNQAAYYGWGGGHFGMSTLWTGVALRQGTAYICGSNRVDWPQAASLDRLIASRIGTGTRFDAFYWGTWPIARDGDNQGPNGLMHYRGPSDPIEPVLAPDVAFDRLFSGVTGDAAKIAKLRNERKSVIDLVKGELARLRAQLPADDRTRLDTHLDSVRKLENQLADLTATCTVPTAPRAFTTSDTRNYRLHPLITRLQLDLMTKALACDLTRVACFAWPHSEMDAGWLSDEGYTPFGSIHTNAHEISYPDINGVPVTDTQRQVARENLANLTQWRSSVIYQDFWSKLMPEVRDQLLVVWSSEMSEPGAHSNRNVPTVIIQGATFGAFRTGRYLKWGSFKATDASAVHLPTGGPHTNQLCVSIAQAMGLTDVATFGDVNVPSYDGKASGPLQQGPIGGLA